MVSLLSVLVVLGVLIFVHELGHFLAAKAVDIAVLRFSLGLGPPTRLSFQRGETEYCVSWIPFGGYVKMAGFEEEGAAGALEGPREATASIPAERTFEHKPLWARLVVMVAGVTMNALFALVAYAGLTWYYGVPTDASVTVGEVRAALLPPGAEGLRTLRPGDRIARIGGQVPSGWDDIVERILLADEPIRILVAGRPDTLFINVPLRDHDAREKLSQALVPSHEPLIGDLAPGYPAANAGLEPDDRVIRINGDTVMSWERMVSVVSASAGKRLDMTVLRRGRELTLPITPRAVQETDDSGHTRQAGKIGVTIGVQFLRRYGPLGSVAQGARQCRDALAVVWFTVTRLVSGRLPASDLGGPILVGQLSGQAARLGFRAFLSFMAFFSMQLALLNMLPIPVLDGGNVVLLLVEGIRRRPVSLEVRQRVATVGLLLIILLMLFATFNDVGRIVRRLMGG